MTLVIQGGKIVRYITVFCFATGIMISGDLLTIHGQFYGRTGALAWVAICAAAVVYWGLVPYLPLNRRSVTGLQSGTNNSRFFDHLAGIFDIAARVLTAVFLTVGLMVSAGFAFNEIFVHWFPNFGFAFALLGFLAVLQWLPVSCRMAFQVLFVFVTLSGLMVLIVSGSMPLDNVPAAAPSPGSGVQPVGLFSGVWMLPMLLFIGPDLGRFAGRRMSLPHSAVQKTLMTAILLIGLLYLAWGEILLDMLPQAKLSQTTIPHILGAKAVLGETGRLIAGAVIITGAAAAVNSLLFSFGADTSPAGPETAIERPAWSPPYAATGIALAAAAGMASGLAGYSLLEILIKGSLCIWLLSYQLRVFQALRHQTRARTVKGWVWFVITGTAWITLAATGKSPGTTALFIAVIASLTIVISFVIHQKQNVQQQRRNP